MNKKQLVCNLAISSGMRKKEVEAVLDSLQDIVANACTHVEEVNITGLIKIVPKLVEAKEVFVPKTGKRKMNEAKISVKVKVSSKLKKLINENFSIAKKESEN